MRGAVKLRYVSCIMVSKSLGAQLPFTASVRVRTEAEVEATFPANTLGNSIALNLPHPPNPTTRSIIPNCIASLSSNKELPPLLNDCILISSALKVVGFKTTRTPLLRVSTLESKMPFSVFTTLPPFSSSLISGSLETLSAYGSSFSFFTSLRTFCISASVGSFTPDLSGKKRPTTMLLSVTNVWNILFTDSTGRLGTICDMIAYSCSMLGIGSPSMKLVTYSFTICAFFILLRSLYTFSSILI